MRVATFLALFAVAALAAPWVLDAWDTERARVDLTDRDARRQARAAAHGVRTLPQGQLVPPPAGDAPDRDVARLSTALGLGKPLPGVIVALSNLAIRCSVELATLAVSPPEEIPRQTPAGERPWLREYRARVSITGANDNVHRFLKSLPELEGPFRVEAARLDAPAGPDAESAALELALRVLVEI